MKPLCLLDGQLVPLRRARVSPLDRGFLYGDGVYETMLVRRGRLLFLDAHLARLRASLAAVAIPEPPDVGPRLAGLLAASGLRNGSVYLQVTRGAGGTRQHIPPRDLVPKFFAMVSTAAAAPLREAGYAAVTLPDPRWQRCDVKTTSLAGNVLGKLAARDAGVDEALFTGPAGELREGASTSLVAVRDGVLETHPLDTHILPGVTRSVVLAAARRAGIPLRETAPRLADRAAWSEAILLGTLTLVQGLTRIDGALVGDGTVGPLTRRLRRLYRAAERRDLERSGNPFTPAFAGIGPIA